MSLQKQLITLIFGIFLGQLTFDYALQRLIIMPGFQNIEREESLKNMTRVTQAIHREMTALVNSATDWATWDDTYRFVQDRNSNYIAVNLNTKALESLKVNLLYLFDTDRKPVQGIAYDFRTEQTLTLAAFSAATTLPEHHPLLALPNPQSVACGIIFTEYGPLLVAAKPILPSTRQGPVQGALVLGRLLDGVVIAAIAEQTQVVLTALDVKKDRLGSEETAVVTELGTAGGSIIRDDGEDRLRVYQILPDLFGQPALLLRVNIPKTISAKGQIAIQYSLLSLIVVGTSTLLLLMVGLRYLVLNPLHRLTVCAVNISQNIDLLTAGFQLNRRDEIGVLAHEFEQTLRHLVATRKALVEQVEKSLLQSEKWLHLALEAASAGAWEWEIGTDIMHWSVENYRLLGLDAECVTPSFQAWVNALHPEDRAQMLATLQGSIEQGAELNLDYRVVWPDGSVHWNYDCGRIELDNCGQPIKIAGIQLDITERKQIEENMHRLSTTDPLTGAFNRRYFLDSLDKEICRTQRYTRPLSLIMFDIDHFKRINDTHGHDVGDDVLTGLATLGRQYLRQQDVFVRWGGEEFIVLCAETPVSEACCLSERLLEALRQHPFPCGSVTASFAVVEYQNQESPQQFLKRLDTLLYAAKANGRNCIECAV